MSLDKVAAKGQFHIDPHFKMGEAMRKKMALMLASAVAAGGISALTSVAHGAQAFTENFASGDVTDGGIWSTAAINNPANVSFTEPVGGPLTIGVASTPEGGLVQTTNAAESSVDFTTSPMLLTLTAPAGKSLAPAVGGGGVFDDRAKTYLGIDVNGVNSQSNNLGTLSESSRPDSGVDRLYLSVNSGNALQMTMTYWDNSGKLPVPAQGVYNINMGYQHDSIPTGPNILITSMFLYADGQALSNDNFWINGGVTWLDTNTNITTTDWLMGPSGTYPTTSVLNGNPGGSANADPYTGVNAYNIGHQGGNQGGNFTPAEDLAILAQFAGNVHVAAEVQDINASATSNSVSFGQLAVAVPEPTSFGLVALGAGMLLRRKNRKA